MADAHQFPMPDYVEPGTGKRMVWDASSHTYIEADEYEGTPSHASGGDFQATNPAVHRMSPKNPDATGILASISRCPKCDGSIGRDDHCVSCGAAAPDFGSIVNQESGADPFPTRPGVPNRENTDRSFPTMSHIKEPDLWDVSNERPRGIMQLTSDNAPTLDACPECGDPMTVHSNDAVCHSCGHKQPVLRVEARQKQAFAPLIPLAMGVARAVGPKLLGQAAKGGALGGLSGVMGKGMALQTGMSAAKGVLDMAGGGEDEAVMPPAPGATTVGSTGPGAGIGTLHGEDDNPEHDGTRGFAEDHSDSPEFNKDVNDIGGTSTGSDEEGEHDSGLDFDDFAPVNPEEMTPEDVEALAKLSPDQVEALAHVGVNWTLIKSFAEDAEADGSQNGVMAALDDMLEAAFPGYRADDSKGDKEPKEASVDGLTKHAARLPRMCPHHKNLVQTALATGDAATALSAMAQHEYGEKSCNGSWKGEDSKGCKYKPQMVTQTFWDEKAQKRNERAEQRQLAEPLPADAEVPEQDELNDDRYEDDLAGETFTPDAEWGDQSVEVQHDGEQGAVMDFGGGDSAVGMGESDRQMAARVAGLAETFPEGSKVHWKFYDRGEGTVVSHEVNQFEASHDSVEVQWSDGTTEQAYPGHLVPIPGGDAAHPGTGHEMGSDVVPDHMPTEWSDTPDDQQGMVMNARVEDFTFGTKLADGNQSEFEPAKEHGNGHPHVHDESAVSGGDNPDITDSKGETLRAGDSYLMRTPEYAVPDKVSIDNIEGDKITYTIHTDSIDYQNTMDLADMLTGGYEFEPDTGGDTPDPDAVDPTDFAPDPEAEFGDDKGDIHKVKNTVEDGAVRKAKTADRHDDNADFENPDRCSHCEKEVAPDSMGELGLCPSCKSEYEQQEPKTSSIRLSSVQINEGMWADLGDDLTKTAGADYSPREQREFVHEKGSARNLDRLDLSNTHYPSDEDLSDHFLLGMD